MTIDDGLDDVPTLQQAPPINLENEFVPAVNRYCGSFKLLFVRMLEFNQGVAYPLPIPFHVKCDNRRK